MDFYNQYQVDRRPYLACGSHSKAPDFYTLRKQASTFLTFSSTIPCTFGGGACSAKPLLSPRQQSLWHQSQWWWWSRAFARGSSLSSLWAWAVKTDRQTGRRGERVCRGGVERGRWGQIGGRKRKERVCVRQSCIQMWVMSQHVWMYEKEPIQGFSQRVFNCVVL